MPHNVSVIWSGRSDSKSDLISLVELNTYRCSPPYSAPSFEHHVYSYL